METSDKMTKEQEQRGIEAEHDDKGNINLVTHCGIGRLAISYSVVWECVEPIDEIFEAIERIDKESSATQIANTHNKEGKQ